VCREATAVFCPGHSFTFFLGQLAVVEGLRLALSPPSRDCFRCCTVSPLSFRNVGGRDFREEAKSALEKQPRDPGKEQLKFMILDVEGDVTGVIVPGSQAVVGRFSFQPSPTTLASSSRTIESRS